MPFTGRATYGTNIFQGMDIDVSEMISMISPFETPLLDRLTVPERPASSVFHEWLEDSLNPNFITAANSGTTTGMTGIGVTDTGGGAVTQYLQVGLVLRHVTSGEYLQVTGIAGNTLTVSRAFGSTTASSMSSGDQLFLVSDAALEGADVTGDISRPRVRNNNYTQIIKKDVIISGTQLAVTQLGVSDELDYQVDKRLREAIRDLEKVVIQGRVSGNSIGTASAYRTMNGIWNQLTTNVTSTGTLTPQAMDNIISNAWNTGGTDCNLIIASYDWKRLIDSWNTSRVRVLNEDERYVQRVTEYEGTFGTFDVMLGRWMPTASLMVLAPDRIKVLPLANRSFRYIPVASTGDATKGMVIGEYTTEVRNQEGMARASGTYVAPPAF